MSANERDKKLKDELNSLMQNMEGLLNSDDNKVSENEDFSVNKNIEKLKQEKKDKESSKIPFDEFDKNFKVKALDIIESMYDFYLDFGVIDRPEYLERKRDLDGLNMSNIFLQLKMTKIVLNKVVDEISCGNVHPRIIEAYSTLNSQFSDIIKSQANYMLFLEESYKKARFETIEYTNNKNVILTSGNNVDNKQITSGETICDVEKDSEYYLTSDPSKLVEEITEKSPMAYEDAKKFRSEKMRDSSVARKFVDPNEKSDLLTHYDVDASTILTDDDNTNDYQDIIDMI